MTQPSDAEVWPYMVLICEGCNQVGIMRFRLKRQAMKHAEHAARLGVSCFVYDREKGECGAFRGNRETRNVIGVEMCTADDSEPPF